MEYVTVWFAASVVCAYFEGRKGRSVFGWSMLGLLFPGAAHMILWLLPSLEFNNAKSRSIALKYGLSFRFRKCLACEQLVQRDSATCKHCRKPCHRLSFRDTLK